ncbi:MAG: HAD family hydrolase [Desulfobacteraceae bacterium]|jgi:HAD superfamily hydrolase (TIGR01549 family)|nr:HAD family hydrolase [Desulfobacteraceae bacterium]
MTRFEVVAFDCDGVLFDTEQANRVYYSNILQHFGRPAVTDEQLVYVHMHTISEALAYLFPDEKTLAAAHLFRETMDYRQYLSYFTVEPHLVSLLQKIKPKFKTAIATNRTDTMNRLLAAFDLEGHFDLIVTASDVERPKPHPDVLLKISDHFNIPPEQVIYIGDSRLDQLAARSAGMPLVAYRNPELSAEYYVNNLSEIEGLLGVGKNGNRNT